MCVRISGKPSAGVLATPSVALRHLRTVVFSQKLCSHEQADDLVSALVNIFLQVAGRFRFLPQLIPSAYFQFEVAHDGPVEELCTCVFELWCLVPKMFQDLEPSCISAVSLPMSALVSECYLLNNSCKDCRERLGFMWSVFHKHCKGSIMITREVLSQMESGSQARRAALQWASTPPNLRASSLCVLPYLVVLLRLLEAADMFGSPDAFAIQPLRLFLSETRQQSTVRPIVVSCGTTLHADSVCHSRDAVRRPCVRIDPCRRCSASRSAASDCDGGGSPPCGEPGTCARQLSP